MPLPFSVHPEGAWWDRVPVRCPGVPAGWHSVARAKGLTFLSCRERLVTVPGTCNECQEIQTGEHQVKPLRIHLYCEQISSKGEGMWNSECWLK